jgi:hypothetical protein
MNRLIFVFILCLMQLIALSQNLFKTGAVGIIDTGFVNPGSTVFSHIHKAGTTKDLVMYDCQPDYLNPRNNIYTVNQQSDLLYFEEYFDSTRKDILTQGYFRLAFIDTDLGYCWVKDLIWNYFDSTGYLIKKEYYNYGKLMETPAMPQPQKPKTNQQ